MSALRVAIIEDSLLLREGLVLFVEAMGHTVVESWPDATSLEVMADALAIDVLITDVRLPPTFRDEGIRAARRLREQRPEIAILVLSQYVETVYARELVSSERGGIGYLLKDRITAIDELGIALDRVAAGEMVLDPQVVAHLVSARRDPLHALTPRERDVLVLMAEGWSNGAIAEKLTVGLGAVEKHVGNIFAKLGLEDLSSGENRRVRAVIAWLQRPA